MKEVPLASGTSLLIKLSTDYDDGKDVNWVKELGKFSISEYAGSVVAGPAGIVAGIVVGGIVETSVDKIMSRIESFNNGVFLLIDDLWEILFYVMLLMLGFFDRA